MDLSTMLADSLDVLRRLAVIGLAVGGVVQIAKFLLRSALKLAHRFPGEGTEERGIWRDGIRTLAVVVGLLVGLLDVWPPWPGWQWAYGPGLGLVAGMSSSALYDAWFRLIDAAPDTLLDTLRARFGAGAASRPGRRRMTRPLVDTTEAPPVHLDDGGGH